MKTKRGQLQPAEMSLFMPLLAILSTTVSLVAVMMFLSDAENSKRELLVPLRLLAADALTQPPNPVSSPSIIIEREEIVAPKGYVYDGAWEKNLRNLRASILGHLTKPNAEKIVIYVEPDVVYEQLIDVLNSFAECKSSHYQIAFLPPLIGPRLFDMREIGESPITCRDGLQLNF